MASRFVMAPASYGAAQANAGLRELARAVARVSAVHVSRRELAELEPRLLDDIGISARQALHEAGRAPWELTPANTRQRVGGGGSGKIGEMRQTLRAMMRRWRTRQRISQLDQHALRDIGVTFADAEREANKAFWQR